MLARRVERRAGTEGQGGVERVTRATERFPTSAATTATLPLETTATLPSTNENCEIFITCC